MKRNASFYALFCAFFTLLATALTAQKPLTLQFSGQEGQVLKLRETKITDTEATVFGQMQKNTNEMTTEYTYTVKKVFPDGSIDWDVEITALKSRESNNDDDSEPKVYASDDPERDTTDLRVKMLDQMVGAHLYMRTDANGQVVDFKGADSLFTAMAGSIPEETRAPTENMLKQNFGDSALLRSMRAMWGDFYPEKPVRKNSRWQKTDELNRILSVNRLTEYTLKKRDKTTAVIACTMTFTPIAGNNEGLDLGAFKISYNLSGTGKGNILLDQPSGLLKRMDNFITLSGTMKIEGSNIPAMKGVPITMKTTSVIERL